MERNEWKRHPRWKCDNCGHTADSHNSHNGAIRDGRCLEKIGLLQDLCRCPGFEHKVVARG